MRLELVGPVEALARLQRRVAAGHAQLHAIAVELHLVTPAVAARRAIDELAQLRFDELGHLRALGLRLDCGLADFAFADLRVAFGSATSDASTLASFEFQIASARASLRVSSMNGFGARPLPAAMSLIARPEATERSSSSIVLRGRRVARVLVAMLDQQPVGALAAIAIALHAHEHPAALQALAVEHELQLALAAAAPRPISSPTGSQ